jgi:hypothetical protein
MLAPTTNNPSADLWQALHQSSTGNLQLLSGAAPGQQFTATLQGLTWRSGALTLWATTDQTLPDQMGVAAAANLLIPLNADGAISASEFQSRHPDWVARLSPVLSPTTVPVAGTDAPPTAIADLARLELQDVTGDGQPEGLVWLAEGDPPIYSPYPTVIVAAPDQVLVDQRQGGEVAIALVRPPNGHQPRLVLTDGQRVWLMGGR